MWTLFRTLLRSWKFFFLQIFEGLQIVQIDLSKMPLGRLSRNHILKAYKVLNDLQQVLEGQQIVSANAENGEESQSQSQISNKSRFIDFTNRFYTLIPHATGQNSPPLLNNSNILKVIDIFYFKTN